MTIYYGKNIEEFERIDDLQWKGLRIIQNSICFVLGQMPYCCPILPRIRKGDKVVDLGTGTVSFPFTGGRMEDACIYGLEIQPDMVEMANRSILLNQLQSKSKNY